MITQTHEQLEYWVEGITALGIIGGGVLTVLSFSMKGWIKSFELEKDSMKEKLRMLETANSVQWTKLDELRTRSESYITRDRHDQATKDMYMAIRDAVTPLMEAINRLSDKLDNIMLENKK